MQSQARQDSGHNNCPQPQYSKNPRVRTYKIKNLLAEICYFNTPKYKNLFSPKNSSRFLYVGLNYFIYNISPKRLSLEIKKLHSETKNAQCMLNVNCCYKKILLQLKECIICM